MSAALAVLLLAGASVAAAPELTRVQRQRYAMGTMFEVIVYHASAPEAAAAADQALAEVVRLDGVLSHYKSDSDLWRLTRAARGAFVEADPSLYQVLDLSLEFSRRSAGRFDVTVAPLVRTWRHAQDAGRAPSGEELAAATRCVGYQHVELAPPDRVRFRSDCLELDLGGIGKGYAVERAMAVLRAAGLRSGLVNAGGSTIAAMGAPPGEAGWPVALAAPIDGRSTLILRDQAISTSQQSLTRPAIDGTRFGEIIDPGGRAPIQHTATVSVVAGSATTADALSTALLLMPVGEGRQMLEQFADVAALWFSPAGSPSALHRSSALRLAASR